LAGLPKNSIHFFYSNIVGTSDMNYYPLVRNKNILDSLGIHSYLICFEGGHTWPPADIFSEALGWTLFMDNRKGKENDPELYSLMSTAINKALEENAFYSASLRAAEMKGIFANTAFDIQADSIFQRILHDPLYTLQIKKLNRIATTEASFQDDIYHAFLGILNSRYNQIDTVHTPSWWKDQYKRCQRLISGKDPEKQKLGTRMDELIATSSYEHGAEFLSEKDYKRAAMAYDILVLFRPEFAYGYLQLARCHKGLNQLQKAEKYLEIARKKEPEKNYVL
jgi:tetratricopeptide (TPR) repeat protein